MTAFKESRMTFDFADDCFYHIEKSQLHSQVEGFTTCECVVMLQDKVVLIEAKSSTPNPKNENDFDDFIYDIVSKFRDTIAFYNAVLLRHDKEVIGSKLRAVDLKDADYQLLLIIYGHREEWLPPVLDELKSKLRHVLKIWKIKDTEVKVINEKTAKEWHIITKFD